MLDGGALLINRLLIFDRKFVLAHDLLKDVTGLLLHLGLDEAFEGLAGDSIALLAAALSLLSFDLLVFVFLLSECVNLLFNGDRDGYRPGYIFDDGKYLAMGNWLDNCRFFNRLNGVHDLFSESDVEPDSL